jgi:anti-sigma factor RsiW
MTDGRDPARREIEDLLPWYAAGTLAPTEARRVEAALARDPELARSYELVREELVQAISLNEALGAPSGALFERLFQRIEAEAPRVPRRLSWRARVQAWLAERRVLHSPRALAWAGAAALAVIVVQAGFLAHLARDGSGAGFEVASGPSAGAGAGAVVLVAFTDGATAAQIAALLQARNATIIEGPRAGGIFRLRLPAALASAEVDEVIAEWRQRPAIVRFAARGQ